MKSSKLQSKLVYEKLIKDIYKFCESYNLPNFKKDGDDDYSIHFDIFKRLIDDLRLADMQRIMPNEEKLVPDMWFKDLNSR